MDFKRKTNGKIYKKTFEINMAGVQGIEPWPTVLETVVLPLNYTPMANSIQQIAHGFQRVF